MAVIRTFQFVKPQVGVFVLLTLLLLVAGVFLAGRAQGWFEKRLFVRATLPELAPDSTLGMRVGDEVQIYGIVVGQVTEVEIVEVTDEAGQPSNRLRLRLMVRGDWQRFVRIDSQVVIKRKFGVAGSPFVQVTAGKRGLVEPDTELPCALATDLTKLIEDALNDFRDKDSPLQKVLANAEVITSNLASGKGSAGQLLSDPAVAESIRQTLKNIESTTSGLTAGKGLLGKLLNDEGTSGQMEQVLTSVNSAVTSLNQTLANVEALSRGLTSGKGLAGKLLNDEGTASQIEEMLKGINGALGNLNGIITKFDREVGDMGGVVTQLRQTMVQVDKALQEIALTVGTLRQQTQDLPGMLLQTQEMMRQSTRTLEGIQKTWLLRDYVPPEAVPRLTPDMGAP